MADHQESPQDQIGQPIIASPRGNDTISKLISHPEIQKLGMDIIKAQIKEAAGFKQENKEAQKKPFGRFMYTVRDVWQGTWWTIPLLYLTLGLAILSLKILSKWAGV